MERIPLGNSAYEGKNNVYLFVGESETVLIDTGDGTASTREQLESALGEHGVELRDIDHVILTHWHGDHTGLSEQIQAVSDAQVYVHTEDASLVEGNERAWADLHELQKQYFEEWGIPGEKQEVLVERWARRDPKRAKPTVTTFEDGDELSFDDYTFQIIHTSGHAAGLCIFEFENEGHTEVISGDALLPVYTPNVGGADVRVERPLERYIRALRDIVDAEYAIAWPGHRDPIDDPTGRANYIIDHHEERSWRVLQVLAREGPCDTWTVSAELFGELDGIHILHGPGEAYAHLDHLERAGVIDRQNRMYRLTNATRDALDELDGERWSLVD